MNIIRTTFAAVLATTAVLGASLFMLAGTAHAETGTEVNDIVGRILHDADQISDSAGKKDLNGVFKACRVLSSDSSTLLDMTKPKTFPKKAWKTTRRAANLDLEGAQVCLSYGANPSDAGASRFISRFVSYMTRADKTWHQVAKQLPT